MELVKGYQLRTTLMIENEVEQLFALYPNGDITSCVKRYSSSFNDNNYKWYKVDKIHEDAEFIGNYYL